jgi:hypothetical protein
MLRYLFLTTKAAHIFLAGSTILLLASCLPAPTPTNAPTPKSSSYAELSSAFTLAPGSSPNEESTTTSLPGEPLAIVSSATQTFPTATPDSSPYEESTSTSLPGEPLATVSSATQTFTTATLVSSPNEESTSTSLPGEPLATVSSATQTFPISTPTNTPTSDLRWSSYYYDDRDIAFRYPENWNIYYSNSWDGESSVHVYVPDKDIGFNFHYPYSEDDPSEDDPTHRLTQWAEEGLDLNWLLSFKPETVVDGGNIMTAGNQSSILTAQGYGLTVQATYFKPKQTGQVMGLVWYAPSDQWDAMGEIFSEILASITFTLAPGSSPNEESTSTSLPDELPTPVSSATQTFPATKPTSDLGWSGYYNQGITFQYPEHWNIFYAYGELSSDYKSDFYICVNEPDKDIGLFIHEPYIKDTPTHRLAQWAEDGMDISGLISFKPETVADGGNIMIAGNQSSILTAQGNGLTVQATYTTSPNWASLMGIVWYAPSDQWDSMGEIFSEILASITHMYLYYTRDGSEIAMIMPGGWSSPIGHPDGKGTWLQSPDQKIGMLIGMMPQGDPSKLLVDWTPGKLTSLGFSNCSVPMPGDRMQAIASKADTMQGKCLHDSGVEVTYTVAYLKVGNDRVGNYILEVVTYFPTSQSEYASWILSLMFESIHSSRSVPLPKELEHCRWDPFSPECNPE